MFMITADITSRSLLHLSHMGDCLDMLTCETDPCFTCQATKVNVIRTLASKSMFFTTEPRLLQPKMPVTLICWYLGQHVSCSLKEMECMYEVCVCAHACTCEVWCLCVGFGCMYIWGCDLTLQKCSSQTISLDPLHASRCGGGEAVPI